MWIEVHGNYKCTKDKQQRINKVYKHMKEWNDMKYKCTCYNIHDTLSYKYYNLCH